MADASIAESTSSKRKSALPGGNAGDLMFAAFARRESGLGRPDNERLRRPFFTHKIVGTRNSIGVGENRAVIGLRRDLQYGRKSDLIVERPD